MPSAMPTMQATPMSAAAGAPQPEAAAGGPPPGTEVFKSPIVGTFYRSPSPDSEAFVSAGSKFDDETVLCIIEAMKVMNEIRAEFKGEVVEVLAENGEPVEFGQPLFLVKKS
jgi:acetyl-CoA carboxylase biotin carboxyl carrier protein